MWLRSNTEKIDDLKFKNKPRHLRLSLPLRFSLGILQLSKKMPSKNQHHRRPRKTIPTASSLCTHSCPRGSITSSSHVFTNPESMKPEFFQWKDQFFVVCFDLFLIVCIFRLNLGHYNWLCHPNWFYLLFSQEKMWQLR